MKRYPHQQIEGLLDKFMNGQTSVEEETLLADYFRTQEVPQEWEDYRLMFTYFDRGMEGDLIPASETSKPLPLLTKRHWWGIAAAAAITAVIASLTVLHNPESTISQPSAIVKTQPVDTPVDVVPEVEMQQLAFESPASPKSASRSHAKVTSSRTRRLQNQNDSLRAETERLQRELADLKRRAFIIDMEANGYKTVLNEDGRIVLIDMEQEIENELNQQPTNSIPEI